MPNWGPNVTKAQARDYEKARRLRIKSQMELLERGPGFTIIRDLRDGLVKRVTLSEAAIKHHGDRPFALRSPCAARLSKPNKNGSEFCQNVGMTGNGRCIFHGGKSIGGTMQHLMRDNKAMGRLRYLPDEWVENFNDFIATKQVRDMSEDVAVLEALICSKLEEIKESAASGPRLMKGLRELLSVAMDPSGSPDRRSKAMQRMSELIQAGQKSQSAVTSLLELIEQKRRIADTDTRQRQLDAAMMDERDATAFAMALIASINNRVTDPKEREAIAYDFARLLSVKNIQYTDSGRSLCGPSMGAAPGEPSSDSCLPTG